MQSGDWGKWFWWFYCHEPPSTQLPAVKWLTASDSLNSLGGGHPCELNAPSSRCSCHIRCLQAVYLEYFFISLLPRFLKCHLCLMAVLINCIWKTHSGHYQLHLQSGFVPNSLVWVICHSPVLWQLAAAMTQNANLLIICNYLYLLTLLVNMFWQGCFISVARKSIWNNIHHTEAAKATWETTQAVVR